MASRTSASVHIIWHQIQITTIGDRFEKRCLLWARERKKDRKKEWYGYVFNLLNKNTAVAFRGRQRIYMALFLSKRYSGAPATEQRRILYFLFNLAVRGGWRAQAISRAAHLKFYEVSTCPTCKRATRKVHIETKMWSISRPGFSTFSPHSRTPTFTAGNNSAPSLGRNYWNQAISMPRSAAALWGFRCVYFRAYTHRTRESLTHEL